MADEVLTITGYVSSTAKDGGSFQLEAAQGHDWDIPNSQQWFRIGKDQRSGEPNAQCPEWKSTVRVTYNISPGTAKYPNATYWANLVTSPNGTPTSEPNPYEAKAQEIEAAEQAYNAAHSGAIRRFETNESIAMQVCIKAVVEAQLGNLSAGVSHPDVDAMSMMITPESIAGEAETLYQLVFVTGPVLSGAGINVPSQIPQDDAPLPEHPNG